MAATEARVPEAVAAVKGVYGLRDQDLAAALGITRKDFQGRRTGRTRFTVAELAGLAVVFGVPVEVFYEEPAVAVRAVLEVDPDLAGPVGYTATAEYPLRRLDLGFLLEPAA